MRTQSRWNRAGLASLLTISLFGAPSIATAGERWGDHDHGYSNSRDYRSDRHDSYGYRDCDDRSYRPPVAYGGYRDDAYRDRGYRNGGYANSGYGNSGYGYGNSGYAYGNSGYAYGGGYEEGYGYRSGGRSAAVIAGSAGAGAVVGAIAGGGKGAAIGAIIGGIGGVIVDHASREHRDRRY